MNSYPIILAHGIARFDELRNRLGGLLAHFNIHFPPTFDALHYFKRIASHLISQGFDTHHASVSFAATVEVRAIELKAEVNRVLAATNQPKAHLIAHSMGGLDARQMITKHDMSDKVASLTTIGTPHNGTPLADALLAEFGNLLIEQLRPTIHLEGFADLSVERCRKFNAEAEADEAVDEVFYQVFASHEARELIFTPLQNSWDIIQDSPEGGDNDGLVPVASQLWQPILKGRDNKTKPVIQHEFPFSADHLNQVGWFDPNQIQMTPAFLVNPFQFVRNYERQVREVYENIAFRVRQL